MGRTIWILAWTTLALAGACSNPDDDTDHGTGWDIGDIGDTLPDDVGRPDDGGVHDYAYDQVCSEQDFDVHHEIVRLMILLDQSSSMEGSPWAGATDAVEQLLLNPRFNDMYFGLDAFPDGYPNSWTNCNERPMLPCFSCSEDECGTLFPPQVPIDICYRSRDAIIAHMNDSAYPQFCTFTPLVNQLAYYDSGPGPTEAADLYRADSANYLVVVSDGEDEGCYDGDPVSALETHTRNIRETHGIGAIAIGFGSSSGTLAAELNAIARNGGTSFTSFLHAEDGPALAAALETIASSVITCTYVLDDPGPSADPELVNFYVDGSPVPMDADCTEASGAGWRWSDDSHTAVTFCGEYCTGIKAGSYTDITATFGCQTIII